MNKSHPKIIVTGGHLTPALATIEEIRERYPTWEIVFLGRPIALEGTRQLSEEYRVVTARNIRFLPITTGRLPRVLSLYTLASLVKLPIGFFQALGYLWREKPEVIVSFGGYVALPVVLAGWLLKIPSITHEQTRRTGLANRLISHLTRQICISFPDQLQEFPQGRAKYTGLPLRQVIFQPPKHSPFPADRDLPLLFITGGSTGATSLNRIVFAALPNLLPHYTLIHQVGRLSVSEAERVAAGLPKNLNQRYLVVPYLDDEAYSWVLHQADCIIGRSGANTVMEIAAVGNIALFVPLPWAGGNEQLANANFLADKGCAQVIFQKDLTPETLVGKVTEMLKNKALYQRCAQRLSPTIPRDGAKRLVAEIASLIHPSR